MRSDPRLVCWQLPVTGQALSRYQAELGFADPGDALWALARAIAASPSWESSGAAVIVRRAPEPLLAVMGRFDGEQQAWIETQAESLEASCERLRYVSYAQAESDCERLSSSLIERLGNDQIRRARFVAIPRGGVIPFGILATVLGLEPEQLEPPHPAGSLLVVIDDCALSGTRFRDFLAKYPDHQRIVFAHLYSHPGVRAAIEVSEPRVVECLSAQDLESRDHPELHASRRARFLAQLEGAFWIGDVDPLGFSWGEPDRLIWHPIEQRPAPAWRIVPPELCLKNRVRNSIPVEVQPETAGPVKPGSEVIFGELEGQVVLHHLGRGESAALDDVASDIWRAVVRRRGVVGGVTEELSRQYPVGGKELRLEIVDFLAYLMNQQFLELDRRGAPQPVPS